MNGEGSKSYPQYSAGQNANRDSRVNMSVDQTNPTGIAASGHHNYSHSSLNQLDQGSGMAPGSFSQNTHPSSFYSGNQSMGSSQMPTTPFGSNFPQLTSPYMMSHLNASGRDSYTADTPSAYFMSPSYPLQAPRSVVKARPEATASDRPYHHENNTSQNGSSVSHQMNNNGQYANAPTVSSSSTNLVGSGKEELPRRVLQFEPSPSHRHATFQGFGADSNLSSSTSPDKMDSLDESHRSAVERYRHHSYDQSHTFQGQYDFYNPAGPSGSQGKGKYPVQSALQKMPASSAKKTSFSPHIANAFDGMPFVDFHPNSESKLDDLIISPAVGMSSRGGRGGSIMRRTNYDLHDNPSFSTDHGSPMSIRKHTSATRYCTPIVTGGNDRNRVASAGTYTGQSEQNYRPSPPSGMMSDYDSHLRHYHRPYPTIRGENPSPVRFDNPSVPEQHYGISPSVHFQTPVLPRFYNESNSAGSGRSNQTAQTHASDASRNQNPVAASHHRAPTHTPVYPPHAYQHPGYPYAYPIPVPTIMSMKSPYEQQYMPYSMLSQPGRKRKSEPRKQPTATDIKKKKMYSDWVGVTFNRTHKKYQACITHFRKQHYLGRYMLAVDAAKAYDMAAKELKGPGWKVNFDDEDEYLTAKEVEMQNHFKQKDVKTEEEQATIRRMYEVVHPTVIELREKLGISAPAMFSAPAHIAPQEGMTYSMLMQNQRAQNHMTRGPMPMAPSHMYYTNTIPPSLQMHHISNQTSNSEGTHSNSSLSLAVTPSPNAQNINKQQPITSPQLEQMTPDVRLTGMSPSTEMTPMSSDSLKAFLMPSTIKAPKVDGRQNDLEDLKGVQNKDIFSRTGEQEAGVCNHASTDKNVAVSALLMIGQ